MNDESILDVGGIPLSECDEMNIPVNIFLGRADPSYSRDAPYVEKGYLWCLTAINYMPRKEMCNPPSSSYRVYAKTREDLVAYMHKHVTPWYEAAAKHLREAVPGANGEFSLYYWPDPKKEE